MARRILRPSERIKLQELGLTREEMDEYADSDFQEVEDWIAVKKYNASSEEYKLFKESGFDSLDEFKEAYDMGFELREEYEQAKGGNFPNRATWIFARELGIMTHKKYLDHLAEQKAIDSLTSSTPATIINREVPVQPFQQQPSIKEDEHKKSSQTPEPDQFVLEKPKPTSRSLQQPSSSPPPDHLVLEKPKPTSRPLANSTQSPPLEQPPIVQTEPTSFFPIGAEKIEDKPHIPTSDEIIAQAHQGSNIHDLLQKYPVPEIPPAEFMDNPALEQMFRFAEVLEQTTQANLEDFSRALSCDDITETEEWLDQFNSSLYIMNFEDNLIIFKPEIYPIVIDKIKKLRN